MTRAVRLSATTATCVVLALWLVSIMAYVCVPYAPTRAIGFGSGSFIVRHGCDSSGNPLRFQAEWTPVRFGAGCSSMRWYSPGKGNTSVYYYAIWPALVALLIPSAVLWLLVPRPIPPGHCQKCGYDLTGNVSGRCPECGTAIETEHKTS